MKLTRKVLAAVCMAATLGLFAGCSKKAATTAGKTLNVMIEVEVESLDPQQATDGTSFEVIADFTDGLKQMNADGSTSNAICASETITADDFVFGWQRAADPKIASEYAYMLSDIGQVKNAAAVIAGTLPVDQLGVKAVDSKTLEVQLEVPVSYFNKILYFPTFYPINKAFYEKCGDKYATSADTTLSNGAFILTDYQPAAVSFKLVKNEKYYDASRIKLAGLNYQVIKDSQQALL